MRAPLTRRKGFATSGDAPEHGVIVLPWATAPLSDSTVADLAGQSGQSDERRLKTNAPFPDSPVADLARQSGQSDERRLKTNAPFLDSTVVTIGELRSTNAGLGSPLPSLRVVEHFWWSRPPHSETSSLLLHIPSEVRGKDSTVVTIGKLRSTNAGLGSPLLSLGMVEHFWWRRLPHRDTIARLLHIPSEVRGCRRAVTDLKHPLERTILIDTGVDAISRNRPGPSTTPTGEPVRPRRIILSLLPSNELEAEVGAEAPTSASVLISPSPLKALRERGIKGVRVPLWGRGVPPSIVPDPDRESIPGRAGSPLLGAYLPASTANPSPPHLGKTENPRKQSKITPEPAHQSKLPLPTPRKGASHPPYPSFLTGTNPS